LSRDKAHPLDLRQPPSEEAIKNQSHSSGESMLIEIGGLLHEYSHDDDLFVSHRLANKMRAELGWFEKISRHGPSVGDFYESLVRSALLEVMPSGLKLGTGFIYDSMTRRTSSQMDLIVYVDKERSPIYRRQEFVVVNADEVMAPIEIKKTLTIRNLRRVLASTMGQNLGTSPRTVPGVQFLNIFAFRSDISLEAVERVICEEFRKFSNRFLSRTRSGELAQIGIMHLVLPRVFFFDRTGYVSTHCRPGEDNFSEVSINVCRSSLEGHSLGEFIVSALSVNVEEQTINERNFLTFPLVQPVSQNILVKNLPIFRRVSMVELIAAFPKEMQELKGKTVDGKKPYGAILLSTIEIGKVRSLYELERTKGFVWMSAVKDEKDKGAT
jgi:hypothetical protein